MNKTLAQLNEGESIFGVAFVQDTLLSDGSTVFDVVIKDGQDLITINALSEAKASECARLINSAIKLAVS